MPALVDLINRSRREYVITIEREIAVVHERGRALVSQREVRGTEDEAIAVARQALRENPDVLVIESLRTPAMVDVALEAAAAGQLVVGGFAAPSATSAVESLIHLYPEAHRPRAQMAFAERIRGVIAQVLLRRAGGGHVAAREILLRSPAVVSAIAEGRTSQLPLAIEGGRRQGMIGLNDALADLVRTGVVDAAEAYRYAADRAGFLERLKRLEFDTTAIERPA